MAASSSRALVPVEQPPRRKDPVAENLRSSNPWIRYIEAQALGRPVSETIKAQSKEGAAEMFQASLGRLGDPFSLSAHAELLADVLTTDQSRLVRHEAARALGTLGEDVGPYVPMLVAALVDDEMLVRRDAAKALAQAAPLALRPHTKALAAALQDEFWPVRLWVCKALGLCGPMVAGPGPGSCGRELAVMAVSDPEDGVREMAARVLGTLGHNAVPHFKWMMEKLFSGSKEEQACVCAAFAYALSVRDVQARRALVRALNPVIESAQEAERQQCIAEGVSPLALADSPVVAKRREAVAALEGALQDEDFATRLRAMEELRAVSSGTRVSGVSMA